MLVTFYKEWTNEYGHKFNKGETVELWDARTALRAKVCVRHGEPIPEDIAVQSQPQAAEDPQKETVTKTKKGK